MIMSSALRGCPPPFLGISRAQMRPALRRRGGCGGEQRLRTFRDPRTSVQFTAFLSSRFFPGPAPYLGDVKDEMNRSSSACSAIQAISAFDGTRVGDITDDIGIEDVRSQVNLRPCVTGRRMSRSAPTRGERRSAARYRLLRRSLAMVGAPSRESAPRPGRVWKAPGQRPNQLAIGVGCENLDQPCRAR